MKKSNVIRGVKLINRFVGKQYLTSIVIANEDSELNDSLIEELVKRVRRKSIHPKFYAVSSPEFLEYMYNNDPWKIGFENINSDYDTKVRLVSFFR